MAKKIVKKRKIKLVSLLLVLLCLVRLFFGLYLIINIKTTNLIVLNTNYLNDDYVLEKAGLIDYPKFFLTTNLKVSKELEKDVYIKKAKLSRRFPFTLVLNITENR